MTVATIFGLWLSVYLNQNLEAILSYILILSFGILHGANDIGLIGQYFKNKKYQITNLQAIIGYVLLVLIIWGLFYMYPVVALGAFVFISSYHFGEQHWAHRIRFHHVLETVFYFLYGAFILFMIFYINIEQVNSVILAITEYELPFDFYRYSFMIIGGLLFLFWGIGAVLKRIEQFIFFELFLLAVFFVIFKTASLLLGFCIYFVIWHSVPSLLDQLQFLYGEVTWSSLLRYIKKSFLFWLASLLGVFGIYFLDSGDSSLIAGLISFLAAITFPHVLVMSRIERELEAHPEANVRGES